MDAFEFIDNEMMTPWFILEAVKIDGLILGSIDDEMQTPEVVLEAVKNSGLALEYVSDQMMTPEIILEAIKQNKQAIVFVKNKMKTPEIINYIEAAYSSCFNKKCIIDSNSNSITSLNQRYH